MGKYTPIQILLERKRAKWIKQRKVLSVEFISLKDVGKVIEDLADDSMVCIRILLCLFVIDWSEFSLKLFA